MNIFCYNQEDEKLKQKILDKKKKNLSQTLQQQYKKEADKSVNIITIKYLNFCETKPALSYFEFHENEINFLLYSRNMLMLQFEIISFCLPISLTPRTLHWRVKLPCPHRLSKNQVWTNENPEILNLNCQLRLHANSKTTF